MVAIKRVVFMLFVYEFANFCYLIWDILTVNRIFKPKTNLFGLFKELF